MTPRRDGKTLIELSVVIGVLSVVMTLSTRTLVNLMRADADCRKSVEIRSRISRLANRFRRDVHTAEKAELVPAERDQQSQSLKLTMPDGGVVEYKPARNSVDVLTSNNSRVTHRERFTLPNSRNNFELTDPKSVTYLHSKIRTVAANSTTATPLPLLSIRVVAIRGRDLRTIKQVP